MIARKKYNLRWGAHQLLLGEKTRVMGVVNITPDSFSDGGDFLSSDRAIAQGEKLVRDGADILDIGGESTRPGAAAVDAETEWQGGLALRESRTMPLEENS